MNARALGGWGPTLAALLIIAVCVVVIDAAFGMF